MSGEPLLRLKELQGFRALRRHDQCRQAFEGFVIPTVVFIVRFESWIDIDRNGQNLQILQLQASCGAFHQWTLAVLRNGSAAGFEPRAEDLPAPLTS